ncbi:MAG TPA: sigma-70 family RNA polymerase sigma factor [Planctomycetaceae bacterium]|nr:sigma-70 family RNA polymerase sigma factor [Planctomycetaceae bacterium]
MASFPDTRASLIIRLSDADNEEAWDEFVRLYQPVVYRLARRRGFQHADAEELVQEVMLAVARAAEGWVPDPQRGRFRTWLHRIARNLMVNFLTRRKHQVWGTGKSDVQQMLEAQSDAQSAVTQMFEVEYRRETFRWAASQVQREVKENTWRAFWLSTIDDLPAAEVARQLKISVGSVYIARSRVMARLRQLVKSATDE